MLKKINSGDAGSAAAPDLTEFTDKILNGDCVSILNAMPAESVDVIFADPPYNLQLNREIYRAGENSKVDSVDEDWDKFSDFKAYDDFTEGWLAACRRVLKPNGTIWVIGSFHNIFRVGKILQDLDYWILNDVIWVKHNPMPNFLGKRFTNAHETLIWASKDQKSKYTFNYTALKTFNNDKQMRSDWDLPICSGNERIKADSGEKAHPTQKPESLIYRILLASTNAGDIVLDPFFGTGTTGAVAKKFGRHFIGIEREEKYIKVAQKRVDGIDFGNGDFLEMMQKKKQEVSVPFGKLIELGYISPGHYLTDSKGRNKSLVRIDGSLEFNNKVGSIHTMGAQVQGQDKCNGWTYWHFEKDGQLVLIDEFRKEIRQTIEDSKKPEKGDTKADVRDRNNQSNQSVIQQYLPSLLSD